MMRLGVCTGFENAGLLADAGFDYLEGAASSVAALDDAAYRELLQKAKAAPLPFEAFNLMVPTAVRLTGPDVDDAITRDYLTRMLERIARLGAQMVVFGSGGARRVPEGFPRDSAYDQLNAYLLMAGDIAKAYSITIAIEPLNHEECNIFNSVAEATQAAHRASHPNVRVLADLYHIAKDGQSYDEIRAAGERMAHVHIISPAQRAFPHPDDAYDFRPFLAALRDVGYTGRISIEGVAEGDYAAALHNAYAVLNPLREEFFA